MTFLEYKKSLGILLFTLLIIVIDGIICIQQQKSFHKENRQFNKEHAKYDRKPVVMIPGVLGTQLEARLNKTSVPHYICDRKSDWYCLWLNLEQFIPEVVDCWVDNIRMVYNPQTKQVHNPEGVEIRVPAFGSTLGFEYLDPDKYLPESAYFAPMVKYMIDELGYVKGKDLFGAPYDWRIAPYQQVDFFSNLRKLIEHAYYANNGSKVAVVGHSMGNLFFYYFLRNQPQQWKDKFISAFASIAAPYLGSVKSVKAILSGDTEGHSWVLPQLQLRSATRTLPSFSFMLPRPDLWPRDKQTLVVTLERNYTARDYKPLFERVGCKDCWQMWRDNGMALGDLRAPGVPVHCIYSSQLPTSEILIYDESLFPDQSPSLVDGSGDGTVNVWSSSACLQWKQQQFPPVYDVEMPGNNHVRILKNTTLHRYLRKVVLL